MKVLLLFTVLILTATVLIAYSLNLLDYIVNVTLYNYELQFSYGWATPYWTILRTIMALEGLTAVLTLGSAIYVYRKYIHAKPRMKKAATEQSLRGVSELVKCIHCGKVFSQPLRMLDFHTDRPRIINICPFCNEVIQPVLHREESELLRKAVQKERKKDQSRAVQESKEIRQEQSEEKTVETEETVATQVQ